MNHNSLVTGLLFPSLDPAEILFEANSIACITRLQPKEESSHLPVIVPGFTDAHCHMVATGLDSLKLDLSAAMTREATLELLTDNLNDSGSWLIGIGYDQNRWNGTHLTKFDLDKLSNTQPILLRHANFHAGVANSKALELAQIEKFAKDPPGGKFGRETSGELNGVVFELAFAKVLKASPTPSMHEIAEGLLTACQHLRRLGIAAAVDMSTNGVNPSDIFQAYKMISNKSGSIPVRFYVPWRAMFGYNGQLNHELDEFRHLIAGVKIFCDGAIGSATAAIYGEYSSVATDGAIFSTRAQKASQFETTHVSGQLIYPPKKLEEMIRIADQHGYPVAVHAIGDYAVDVVMDCFEKISNPGVHRIEHAMILSDQQVNRLARIGCSVSMQPEFLTYFGRTYNRQLGEVRAQKLNRYKTLINARVPLSLSSDRPIIRGNPLDSLSASVQRPSGFAASENITLIEAISGWTSQAATMSGFPDHFGKISVGSPSLLNILKKSQDLTQNKVCQEHWNILDSIK